MVFAVLLGVIAVPVVESAVAPARAAAANQGFGATLVATAQAEHDVYGGQHECNDAPLRQRVGQYWANINWTVGGCDRDQPWSAAFVSQMMRDAGAGDRFAYSAGHYVYIRDAFRGGRGLYNEARDITTATVRPGDLVCRGRQHVSHWDFDDFSAWAGGSSTIPTHCDIVTAVNGSSFTVIGGNVSDTVKRETKEKSGFAIVLPLVQAQSPTPTPTPTSGSGVGTLQGKGGLCLDLPNGNTQNGTNLQTWTCNGHAAQEWTLDNGEFRVKGKCLDIEGTERAGSRVQITQCGFTGDLNWYMTNIGEIRSERFPNLCVDIQGGSTTRGTAVQMWHCNGTLAQSWNHPSRTVVGRVLGKGFLCLDLPNQNTANGTNLQMWACNGTAAQKWTFVNEQFKVKGKCLAIEGQAKPGANVEIKACSNTWKLDWYVSDAGEIKSELFPNLCLDVRGGGTTSGTPVQLWGCNDTIAQRWIHDGGSATPAPPATTPPTAPPVAGNSVDALLDLIADGEGTGHADARANGFASGYDVPLGYNSFTYNLPADLRKPVSTMTIAEVLRLGDIIRPRSNLNSSALGRYQIVGKTLEGLQAQLGLPDSAIFDAELQDRLAIELLKRRGLTRYQNGTMTGSTFQLNLAKEWASIARDASGIGYYGGRAETTNSEIDAAIRAL